MQHTILLVFFLSIGTAVCRTKNFVPEYPTFGNPVTCIVEEARKSANTQTQLDGCHRTYCSCVGGIYANTSFQCQPPYSNRKCDKLDGCFPSYLDCIADNAAGCAWAAQQQCEEHVMETCDEGDICKIKGTPSGLTAGAIFAIAAGIIYTFALVIVIVLIIMAKKREAPAYDASA
eukprot:NODE_3421_length_776_cov_764.676754_g2859_i0.p1 GENE.NODE_3421_length_776_cov_764.676754_g2859_i0~~NODE_3421_length_776_cov_764.676754_g2859_i0.p1  ORF type:complete len:175 (+),score=22.38 NODE_3421_length_776_cov_764.676754_g2859_i0:57-581(+)